MADVKLQDSAETHFNDPRTKGEWALSIATVPGATADQIVSQAPSIRQRVYRTSMGHDLSDEFKVVSDRPPHGLIILDGWPDAGTCERLRALFSGDQVNPHYDERRRRGR